jgi:hypothetical protein
VVTLRPTWFMLIGDWGKKEFMLDFRQDLRVQ